MLAVVFNLCGVSDFKARGQRLVLQQIGQSLEASSVGTPRTAASNN
jgi:hypothetical protein